MEGPPLGPGGEDITWPNQVAPRGQNASSTRKIKPQTSNPNERGRGDGDQETKDRERQRQTPRSHNTTWSKTTHNPRSPKKKKKAEGGGQTPPTATPAHPHLKGSPTRRYQETDAAHARGHAPRHPRQQKTECRQNPNPHTNTHTPEHPKQQIPEPKHTHPKRTPQPGVAGYKRSAHTNKHTPHHPGQECRGAAQTIALARTPAPHLQPRRAGDQAQGAQKHTHTRTPQPGVAGRSRNQSPSTHTHTAHPNQESRCTGEVHTQAHTHPNPLARTGGAQPKPEPKHTHPHRTPRPGVAGYKGSARTDTHTPQHPSQEWQGLARTRAQTETQTPHTPTRSGSVQTERSMSR